MSETIQLHATCVSVNGKGVLLLGPSGSGKSDLALRLIDCGAELVADDRVDIILLPSPLEGESRVGGMPVLNEPRTPHPNPPPQGGRELIASAPSKLCGLLEVRGIGIMTLPYVKKAVLALAVQLVAPEAVERLPEPKLYGCLGAQLPLLSLHAFDPSTDAKIRLYLRD